MLHGCVRERDRVVLIIWGGLYKMITMGRGGRIMLIA